MSLTHGWNMKIERGKRGKLTRSMSIWAVGEKGWEGSLFLQVANWPSMKTFSNWSWSIRVSSVVIQRCVRKGQGIIQIDRQKMELLNIRSKTIKKQGNNGLREDQVIVRATSQFSILAELWDSLHPSARPTLWSNWYHVSQRHTLFSDSPVPACRASRLKSMILWCTCRSWSRNDALRYINIIDTQTFQDTASVRRAKKYSGHHALDLQQVLLKHKPKKIRKEHMKTKQKSRTQYTEIQKASQDSKGNQCKIGKCCVSYLDDKSSWRIFVQKTQPTLCALCGS